MLPKSNLDGGFIGDTYPLCYDLPPRAFLHAGATYRYLGYSRHPQLQSDPASYEAEALELTLDRTSSSLYTMLCDQRRKCCVRPATSLTRSCL